MTGDKPPLSADQLDRVEKLTAALNALRNAYPAKSMASLPEGKAIDAAMSAIERELIALTGETHWRHRTVEDAIRAPVTPDWAKIQAAQDALKKGLARRKRKA